METRRILAIAGSLVMAIGVFLPVVRGPLVGDLNYFRNGEGDGVLLLALALLSLLLAVTRRFHWLWTTGLAALMMLAGSFLSFQALVAELQKSADRDLAGNPFRGLADIAIGSTQLEWGWAVLVLGAALLVTAAAIRPTLRRKCPFCAEQVRAEASVCRYCERELPPEPLPVERRVPLAVPILS